MDDRYIVALLQKRSEVALDAIAEKIGGQLYAIAKNILDNAQDAQECVNDTYLALWNAIPPEDPDPLSAYAFRICRNKALSRLRQANAAKRSGCTLSLDELAECVGADGPEGILDAKALGRAIDRFLDTLPRESRVIFLRRYWFGDSVSDIARARGLRENAVSVRLTRMRSKLKHHLTKEGLL